MRVSDIPFKHTAALSWKRRKDSFVTEPQCDPYLV